MERVSFFEILIWVTLSAQILALSINYLYSNRRYTVDLRNNLWKGFVGDFNMGKS